ncbi:hypothetical protein LOD99_9933 [Oopsacas minuta]|uniref:Transposase n=1 Tax=Oopsacas minuta TaxID=111878 RepID=A0AAV7KS12_9METZ|nr:hypothetical protein LOD99_9933 [Oopsacas minuta]
MPQSREVCHPVSNAGLLLQTADKLEGNFAYQLFHLSRTGSCSGNSVRRWENSGWESRRPLFSPSPAAVSLTSVHKQRRKTTDNLVPVEKGKTGSNILREMRDIVGDECPSIATIYRWIERFDNGDEDLHDDPRPGRPTSSKTRSNIERVQTILDKDRRITLQDLEERVGMSKATLHSIITENLEMS